MAITSLQVPASHAKPNSMIALSATPMLVSNAQHTTIYCRIKPAPAAAYTPNIANNAPKIFALNAMISSTSKETIVITVLL